MQLKLPKIIMQTLTTAMEIMEQSGAGAENYLDLAGEVSLVKERCN